MATYGVKYASGRAPRRYGPTGSLASLYGQPSMEPMSSVRPIAPNGAGFQAINAPAPLDALSRVLQNGQNTFDTIAPTSTGLPTTKPPITPPPSSTYQGTDMSADPILTQIKALGLRSAQDAATGGLAGAKNDLINYGGVDVPQSLRDLFSTLTPAKDELLGDLPSNPVLAALNDVATGQAAAKNPFSTRMQLSNAHTANNNNIDQTSNLANLFYSSTHANQLGQENTNYLGAQNTALQNLAALLSGEDNGLLSAIDQAHQNYLGELPNAYQRAIDSGFGAPGDGTVPPGDGTTPPPGTTGGLTPNVGSNTAGANDLFNLLQRKLALAGGYGGSAGPSRTT